MTQIYLISPPKIELKPFAQELEQLLKTGLVPTFQLRLKDYEESEVKNIAQEIKKICDDNNCLFLLNDFLNIALEIGASGVHLGADDGSIKEARNIAPENFVIGASCYDSKDLAMKAGGDGADYLSFGAFFETKTKISRGKPTLDLIRWCHELIDLPIVTIGGINDHNCKSLADAGADFISVISYIWSNKDGSLEALKKLNDSISM